jgi:SAM-dependent methyltransferase
VGTETDGTAPRPSGLRDLLPRESREFERIRGEWSHLGESARTWAVAEVPGGPPGGANATEFLNTGAQEVRAVAERARALSMPFEGACALDFGCGPGRMTQALASNYREVVGVDVSSAMAELARRLLRTPLPCRFESTHAPDLRQFDSDSFDLTFSVYVLQHLPPWLAERYVREFVRVTRPGGSIVFQLHGGLASRWLQWVSGRRLPRVLNGWQHWKNAHLGAPVRWEVYWWRPHDVADLLRAAGVRVRAVDRVPRPDGHLQGYWFYGTRDPRAMA